MKKKLSFVALLLLAFAMKSHSQNPLPPLPPHGVYLTWSTPTLGPAPTGYNVYRCFGTCTLSVTTWIALTAGANLPATATSFVDSSTGPQQPNLNTTYTYVVQAFNTTGAIQYSNLWTVTTPATAWPTNPAWASNLTGSII